MNTSVSRFCAFVSMTAAGLVAYGDSAMASPGGGLGEEKSTFAQSAMSAGAWTKLDSSLRTRSLAVPNVQTVSMFVQSSNPESTRKLIEAAGGYVGTVAGDILTARVPRNAVNTVASAPSVVRLEGARIVRSKLDKAAAAIKVDKVHAGTSPLSAPYKGAGVVVGVLDIGLDFQHAAFKKPDGKTRVRALWDQGATGTPPAGFSYGSECTAAQIDGDTCAHRSTQDHGTHVTGIAAGSPVTGAPYVGVAPEADIVFVNLGNPADTSDEALSTAVCDAASYIFKLAAAANMPAVINMSIGEHSGPHDGTALGDKCLDNLTGPGKILVAAAGNEGKGSVHATQELPVVVHATATASEQPVVLKWLPGKGEDGTTKGELYLWSDSNVALSVRVGFASPSVGTPTYSAPITVERPLAPSTLSNGSVSVGNVIGAGGSIPSGARGIQIAVQDSNKDGLEDHQSWFLEVTGNGRFDAFIDTTSGGGFLATDQAAGVTTDSNMTIGFPAIASKVLAVASFVSRNSWKAADGSEQVQRTAGPESPPVTIGALSSFSSHGPSRNPNAAMKPDIAAPGEILASALNSGASPAAERVAKSGPNGFLMAEGTSMASPMVTGVVALMLQKNRSVTVDDVRAVFDRTAVKPDGVTSVPNTLWGRGKVDALAALADKGSRGSSDGCQLSPTDERSATFAVCASVMLLGFLLVRRRGARSAD
ncbi:S8 family serine peptidase [Pendulispora rubella]|uniref:S8 family serine peptidase n=1 Tax=Pendulispora rubella TaxID=2741070 RepID=A0ABZ2L303_9BACT